MKKAKKLINFVFSAILLFCMVLPQSVNAASLKSGETGTIKLQLDDIGTNWEGVEFSLYQVDDVMASLGIDYNSLTHAADVKAAARTILEQLEADEQTGSVCVTDSNGSALWQGLKRGVYLIAQQTENEYGVVDPFLIGIPYIQGGVLNFEIVITPKVSPFESTPSGGDGGPEDPTETSPDTETTGSGGDGDPEDPTETSPDTETTGSGGDGGPEDPTETLPVIETTGSGGDGGPEDPTETLPVIETTGSGGDGGPEDPTQTCPYATTPGSGGDGGPEDPTQTCPYATTPGSGGDGGPEDPTQTRPYTTTFGSGGDGGPEDPMETSEKTEIKAGAGSKTGDGSNVSIYYWMAGIGTIIVVFCLRKIRKEKS